MPLIPPIGALVGSHAFMHASHELRAQLCVQYSCIHSTHALSALRYGCIIAMHICAYSLPMRMGALHGIGVTLISLKDER